MNFLEAKQRLAERCSFKSDTLNSAINTRLGRVLNEVHREIMTKPGMRRQRQGVVAFATVADRALYALPLSGVKEVHRIIDPTNQRRLVKKDMDWYRAVDPDPQSGEPDYWIPAGYAAVALQPSDASELFLKSTSASDTQVAYVEGLTNGGHRRSAQVTLTGTTAISLAAAITDWALVDDLYLASAAAGTVTLHEDSGSGTELARVSIGRTRARYLAFYLYLTPASALTLNADVTLDLEDMSNDTDEPMLDEDFHDLWLDLAELKERKKSDDPDRYNMVKDHARERMTDLRAWLFAQPDDYAGDQVEIGSNLGSWYPSGRW